MILVLKLARPLAVGEVPEFHRRLIVMPRRPRLGLSSGLGDPARIEVARRTAGIVQWQDIGVEMGMLLIDMLDHADQAVAEQATEEPEIAIHPCVVIRPHGRIGHDLRGQIRVRGHAGHQRMAILSDTPARGLAAFRRDGNAARRDHLVVAVLDFLRRQAEDDAIRLTRRHMLRELRRAASLGQNLLDRLALFVRLAGIGLDVEKLGTGHRSAPVAKETQYGPTIRLQATCRRGRCAPRPSQRLRRRSVPDRSRRSRLQNLPSASLVTGAAVRFCEAIARGRGDMRENGRDHRMNPAA